MPIRFVPIDDQKYKWIVNYCTNRDAARLVWATPSRRGFRDAITSRNNVVSRSNHLAVWRQNGQDMENSGGDAMAQLDWAIDIVPVSTGGAAFQPKLAPPVAPGAPLNAQLQDIVTWGNRTTETHQPWPTVDNSPTGDPVPVPAQGNPAGYMSDPIPPNSSSQPQFVVPAPPTTSPPTTSGVIYYCCRFHPTERGQINWVESF